LVTDEFVDNSIEEQTR